jgi:hypothetical protein
MRDRADEGVQTDVRESGDPTSEPNHRPVNFAEVALALTTLTILAIGLPVVATLGNGPTFFVAHRAPTSQIITLLGLILGGPALVAILVLLLFWAVPGPQMRSVVALALIAVLTGLLSLQHLSRVVSSTSLLAVLAPASGALAGMAYLRWGIVRRALRELAFGTLVIPLWFVFISPASGLFSLGTSGTDSVLRVRDPVPLTIVVFDEFHTAAILDRDGQVDAERFPNFGRLAAESTWYPRAITQSFRTINALPSIVSGELPLSHQNRAPTWQEFPNTIFSALAPHYDIGSFQSYVDLCPPTACADSQVTFSSEAFLEDLKLIGQHSVLPRSFVSHLPTLEGQWSGFARNESNSAEPGWGVYRPGEYDDLYRILDSMADRPRNQFNFIHVLEPHAPHDLLSDGRRHSLMAQYVTGKGPRESWTGEAPLIEQAYLHYLHHVGIADAMLGDIISAHEAAGVWDEAMVVVVADHGVAHVEDRRSPSETGANWQEIYRVPYFVKYPRGQYRGVVDPSLVTLTDILPTVANVLGFHIPWPIAGSPIQSDAVRNRTTVEVDTGNRSLVPLPTDDTGVLRRLQWQFERFGDGTTLPELKRHDGLNGVLIDQSVSDLSTREAEGGDPRLIVVGGPFGLAAAVSGADFLPARVFGRIEGPESERPIDAVVAALDGIIVAVAVPSKWGVHDRYWEMLLPPAALERSSRVLDLYLVQGCRGTASSCELTRTRAGTRGLPVEVHHFDRSVISVDDSTWVVSESLGQIDSVSTANGIATFRGWAAHPESLIPPEHVVVLSGSSGVMADVELVDRPDVVEHLGVSIGRNRQPPGFGWVVAMRSEVAFRAGENLRIIALFADRSAGEVPASAAVTSFLRADSNEAGVGILSSIEASDRSRQRFLLQGVAHDIQAHWGHVEFVTVESDRISVTGWSANVANCEGPKHVFVAHYGVTLASTIPRLAVRPDVRDFLQSEGTEGCELERHGWEVSARFVPSGGEVLDVVTVFGDGSAMVRPTVVGGP